MKHRRPRVVCPTMLPRGVHLVFGCLLWLTACADPTTAGATAQLDAGSTARLLEVDAAFVQFTVPFTLNPPRPTGLNKNECPLLPALERVLFATDNALDCGALPRYATTSMRQAAQDCVLEAQRAARAFRVSYEPASYDTLESAGLAAPAGGPSVFVQRTSTPTAPWVMRANLRTATCNELRVRDDCTFESGDLCLDCMGAHAYRELCEKLETF